MAQKNFFVDINLQGNKLANSVVGANSSMTTGGAFQYSEGRLEYYDGATVQEVANLSDISAITGGLIFQGGYDPTTNTPDITDGTALKGFFWAATNAGSFLGESVQVGDSIIAKVDNAGATINDWLILQGNVVIATDTVDGISRLATQAEANAGTEGGAVVITPATLQGKIDAQITPEISSKLPLSGGTMSGSIDMGLGNITNINFLSGAGGEPVGFAVGANMYGTKIFALGTPTADGEAANKEYVDGAASNAQANAEAYADGLAVNYDAAGSAATAQANAEAYADSLAPNYDAAGAAATAQANAEAYADADLATKLNLTGGTVSGSINLDNNDLLNASLINAKVGSTLDVQSQFVINLTDPTNAYDAAPKIYVDATAETAQSNAETFAATAAATAESNANSYTNTQIDAQSFSTLIEGSAGTSGWTFDAILGAYKAEITHNLGNLVTLSVFYDGAPSEFAGEYDNNVYYIYSNVEPVNNTVLNFIKAGGNL